MLLSDKEIQIHFNELAKACIHNDLEYFNNHIDKLPNLELKNENGWTLLIMAAFAHSYEITNRLIKLGANVNATNNKGTTVLMYAKTKVKDNCNFQFLDFLIESGANVSAKDAVGKNVLDYVRDTKDEPLVKYFEKKLTATFYGK